MKLRAREVRQLMAREDIRSQAELARRINVSHNTVYAWLAGSAFPEQDNLDNLCEALRCSEYEIVELDGDPGEVVAPALAHHLGMAATGASP